MPRLLVCRECQTIETLPLYDGPPQLEARDPLLDNIVRRHVAKHGDINPEGAALLVAPEGPCNCGEKTMVNLAGGGRSRARVLGAHTFWEGHRDDILKGLGERWTGFHPEFYATIDTYKEDAARCYSRHRRPKDGCIDWRDDSKRLTDDNREKDKHVYLCDFCVVATTVTTAIRKKGRMYDREPGEID